MTDLRTYHVGYGFLNESAIESVHRVWNRRTYKSSYTDTEEDLIRKMRDQNIAAMAPVRMWSIMVIFGIIILSARTHNTQMRIPIPKIKSRRRLSNDVSNEDEAAAANESLILQPLDDSFG